MKRSSCAWGALACISAASLTAAALSSPALAEEVPTCNGLPATIVMPDDSDRPTYGTEGDDVVVMEEFGYYIDPGGNDTICGGDRSDDIYAGTGDDWVDGGGGNDVIAGGSGDDELYGGGGNDTVHDDQWNEGRLDYIRDDGADFVDGGAGRDTIYLNGGDRAGNGGVDVAVGGAGTDVISYSRSETTVELDVAAGTSTGSAVDHFSGFEKFSGDRIGGTVLGTDGDDILRGYEVHGRGGDDRLAGTVVRGGPGNDNYRGDRRPGHVSDIRLGKGRDIAVVNYEASLNIRFGPGRDRLHVIPPMGVDTDGSTVRARGGPGRDVLTFKRLPRPLHIDVAGGKATWGYDSVARFRDFEEFVGGSKDDQFYGTDSKDHFNGGPGDDVLRGYRGADVLIGGSGDDVLRGHRGHDLLLGKTGHDAAHGYRGIDTCRAERRFSCELD